MFFQLFFILASLEGLSAIAVKHKRGEMSMRSAFFWGLLWVAADIAVLWPNTTTIIANTLGVGRGTDLVLYLSVVLVFVVLFRLHVKIEGIQRDVTKVVREKALQQTNTTALQHKNEKLL